MTSVQVTTKVDLDQLIAGADQLETSELEAYVAKVSLLLARRKAESLSAGETELLKQINCTLISRHRRTAQCATGESS